MCLIVPRAFIQYCLISWGGQLLGYDGVIAHLESGLLTCTLLCKSFVCNQKNTVCDKLF